MRPRRLTLTLATLLLTLFAAHVSAQDVRRVPDVVSWGTAFANPTWAAVEAWRSEDRACRLSQLALSEAIGNAATLIMKHVVDSARPCIRCPHDGMPSGHTMNGSIGVTNHWRVGLAFTVGTAGLRMAANRHTFTQVSAGAALGIGADSVGRLIRCH